MTEHISEPLAIFLEKAKWLLETYPTGSILIILIFLDFASGLAVAISTKSVSSSASYKGMCKKAMTVIVWGVAATIEPLSNGIPLGKLVALFYIFTESVSIMENAAALGIPLPSALLETLGKFTAENKRAVMPPSVNVDVHSDRTIIKATPTSDGPPASVTVQTLEKKNP